MTVIVEHNVVEIGMSKYQFFWVKFLFFFLQFYINISLFLTQGSEEDKKKFNDDLNDLVSDDVFSVPDNNAFGHSFRLV